MKNNSQNSTNVLEIIIAFWFGSLAYVVWIFLALDAKADSLLRKLAFTEAGVPLPWALTENSVEQTSKTLEIQLPLN